MLLFQAVIIRNLSNENYRLRIQSHLFDLEDLSSDFSSNQQFNCINNNDDEITINFMELIGFISFIFISIFAIVILLSGGIVTVIIIKIIDPLGNMIWNNFINNNFH